MLVLLTQATAQAQLVKKVWQEPFEVMEIFEGDLKGAGYPRNGKACQGEIPALAPTQRLLLQAQFRREDEGRGTQWKPEALSL